MTARLASILRCPADKMSLQAASEALVCPSCRRRFPHEGGIVHMLDERALEPSARDQMAVYDERFRQMTPVAHENLFASEFVYRTELLGQALAALGIGAMSADDVWLYIGGGEGTQCMALSERGGMHVSFDVSLGQLRTGRWLLDNVAPRFFPRLRPDGVSFVWGDGEKGLPFADGCAAAAYGIGVLNHLPPAAWGPHLAELARVVRKNGVVFEIVPNPASAFFRKRYMTAQFADPHSLQYWTQFIDQAAVETAFREAGLADVRTVALWRLDHDAVPGRYWRLDFMAARVVRRVLRGHGHPGIVFQRLMLRACERRLPLTRHFAYEPPKHLLVAGRR